MIEAVETDHRLTLRINRPDKANSLTGGMLRQLRDHVSAATKTGKRSLVLTGTGNVFSAGADLEEARAGLATDPVWEELSAAVAAFPGLSVAALNGTVAGGAIGMVLAADMRIAVTGSRLFYPVMKLGFLPQPSDPWRMAALIGPARSKLVFLGGDRLSDQDALNFGLFDRVVDADQLAPAVDALLADCEAAETGHGRAIKALFSNHG